MPHAGVIILTEAFLTVQLFLCVFNGVSTFVEYLIPKLFL